MLLICEKPFYPTYKELKHLVRTGLITLCGTACSLKRPQFLYFKGVAAFRFILFVWELYIFIPSKIVLARIFRFWLKYFYKEELWNSSSNHFVHIFYRSFGKTLFFQHAMTVHYHVTYYF